MPQRGPRTMGERRSRALPRAGAGQPADGGSEDGGTTTSAKTSRRPALSLKGRALAYLARREYSRLELQRKLAPHAATPEALEQLLDTLEQGNFLSNTRFAESVVHRRASRLGTARIVNELKQHAVDAQTVATVAQRLRDSELERARGVWRKKFGTLAETPEARAKQVRFLAGRGFSRDVIAKVIRHAGIDELPED